MGFLSFLKNLNLGSGMPHMPTTTSAGTMQTKEFEGPEQANLGSGMPHMPTTTSAGTMQTKEFEGPEQANKTPLAGDNHEITEVDKVTRIKSDESGSCTSGMDWTFNHPSRKDNVEGKLKEAVSGQRRLANFKGDQGLGNVASSENAGQIECKVNFLGLPIRPGGKECPSYMRTGGCESASRCRFHHPDPTAVVGDIRQDRKNGVPSQHQGPVEQFCGTPRPSENISNEQTAFLGPFTPNRGVQQNVHWIGNPMATSPLDPPEINIDEKGQELANKNTSYEFNDGAKSQQFDEYPQRPGKPECQYFVKTGYCKFKSACIFHHPRPNLSDQSLPPKPMATSPLDPPEIKIDEKGQELGNKNTVLIFNGCTKSQHFDEYPQRPTETECQHFMKTGYCKFKSACRFHHPKPHLSFQAPPVKPITTSPLNPPPPEIKKNKKDQKLATKDAVQEFNGGVKSQQFDEYPQRPSEPERQHFMKTGSSKGKSPCRSDHPKSNLNIPAGPQKSIVTSPLNPPPPEIKKDKKDQKLATKDTVQEFNGGVKSQQFDEYPQRPSEPERQHFMKTGPSKGKSACTCHHPKSNLSIPAGPQKSIATSPLNPAPPEIKKNKKDQKLATKDTVQEFNGGVKSQQFDEYPQRPSEPERQHFMKTGPSKGKSACTSHHPKSNLSIPVGPQKSDKQTICTNYSRSGNCKFGSACRFSHHIEHT